MNKYFYRVLAKGAAADSDYASTVVSTPDRAPAEFQVAAVSPTRVDFRWFNAASIVSGFQIERATLGGPFVPLQISANFETFLASDFTAQPMTTYTYRITANTGAGPSRSATTFTVRTPAPVLTSPVGPIDAPVPSKPDSMVQFGGAVYFTHSSVAGGRGPIYRTDGTAAGTTLVFDGSAAGLFRGGDHLYFTSDGPGTGVELWRTDGTTAGTHLVADVVPGPTSSNPIPLGYGGGKLFFAVPGPDGRLHEVWTTQGTAATTRNPVGRMLVFNTPDKPRSDPVVRDGVLYYSGHTATGEEPWRTDGTPEGTFALADLFPGATGSTPYGFTVLGDAVYFFAYDPQRVVKLFKTDGTPSGTVLVKELDHTLNRDPYENLTAVNGLLYFSGFGPLGTTYFWRSDGTPEGTFPLAQPDGWGPSLPSRFTALGDAVLLLDHAGFWRTDGTVAGTAFIRLMSLNHGLKQQAYVVAADGKSVFLSDGLSLWRTDGTFSGTHQVAKIATDVDSQQTMVYSGALAAALGDKLLFGSMTADGGRELRVAYTTPPAAPTEFAAAGNSLTWKDGSSNETGFVIERSTRADFATIDAAFFAPVDATSYEDGTAQQGVRYFYRMQSVNAGGASAFSAVVSGGPPTVVAASFDYGGPGPRLVLRFDSDVSASLEPSDLVLVDLSTGEQAPAALVASLAYDHSNNSATAKLAAPPDGRYRLTLRASDVSSRGGTPLDGDADGSPGGDYTFTFSHLAADANRDGKVDFADLVVLAQNYGAADKSFESGDFTHDGKVDFADLVVLAQRYNTALPPPAVPSPPTPRTGVGALPSPATPFGSSKRITAEVLSSTPQPGRAARPPQHRPLR
jgi:ELWxxDGT repeat protein